MTCTGCGADYQPEPGDRPPFTECWRCQVDRTRAENLARIEAATRRQEGRRG